MTVRTDRHVLPTALLSGVALAAPFAIAAPSADGVAGDQNHTYSITHESMAQVPAPLLRKKSLGVLHDVDPAVEHEPRRDI